MRTTRAFFAFLPLFAPIVFAGPLGAAGASRPPAPRELVEMLPPSARGPLEGTPPIPDALRTAQRNVVVERFFEADAAGSGWLEVEYTVDPRLDARVKAILKRGRVDLGHVIVLDPSNGRVLSYVSTDPVRFPASRIYPTASLMKVVTAAAVLHHAPEAATRDCRYAGSPYKVRERHLSPPDVGDRVDSFWRSLAISNNQCFARLAVRDIGAATLVAEMKRAGMLERPAAGHEAGKVDRIETPLDLGRLGSGLSGSFITPLAAVRLAALLPEGTLVRPRWISRITDGRGRRLALPDASATADVWPRAVADELRTAMIGVTSRGTAKSAFRDERGRPMLGKIQVAGKTGSLRGTNPDGRYEWFIGVAPAERPRVAIVSLVVNGSLWWSSASQIAARVLREMFCPKGRCREGAVDAWIAGDRAAEAAVGG